MIFNDRRDAGKKLAEKLVKFKEERPVILAIPRGGVVIGREIANALNAPLSIIVPRKLGAPYNPELAIGAVTRDGSTTLNEELIVSMNVSQSYIEKEKKRQMDEIERRIEKYKTMEIELRDRVVILVDDGIATGATMLAAIKSVEKKYPKKIVLAVPVGPPDTIKEMGRGVDEVVCLYTPAFFMAIGSFYRNFEQTTDDEVIEILKSFR